MKGLLIKDFRLVKMQKQFFIAIAAIAVVMAFSMDNLSFLSGYLTFVMPMFALSTLSYDDFDNGSAFLFTLPVSRREYVLEKYLFGLILGLAALVLSTLLILCFGLVKEMSLALDALTGVPLTFAAMLLVLSVMLPFQIKFGADKSRIAIVAVGGLALLLGFGVGKLLDWLGVDITGLVNWVQGLPAAALTAAGIGLAALVLAASLRISTVILEKKEF